MQIEAMLPTILTTSGAAVADCGILKISFH
jgi:hypothetical protein